MEKKYYAIKISFNKKPYYLSDDEYIDGKPYYVKEEDYIYCLIDNILGAFEFGSIEEAKEAKEDIIDDLVDVIDDIRDFVIFEVNLNTKDIIKLNI